MSQMASRSTETKPPCLDIRSGSAKVPRVGDGVNGVNFKQHLTYFRPHIGEYTNFTPPYVVPVCWGWTIQDIDDWLLQMGHGKYREVFRHMDMNGKKLTTIDAHYLRRSGIRNWDDCIALADAARKLSESLIQLDIGKLTEGLYPQYPTVYFGQQSVIPRGAQLIHRTERFHADPYRNEICRRLYRTAGDPFGYLSIAKRYSAI